MAPPRSPIDPNKAGFCQDDGVFYSKRERVELPSDPSLTLPDLVLHRRADFDASAIAYIDASTGRRLCYGEFRAHVESVAEGLCELAGVRHGDVVMLLAPNCISFPILLHAILSIGAVVTTTNPLNHPSEISKQMLDSGASFVACTPSLLPKVISSLSTRSLPLILIDQEEEEGGDDALHNASKARALPSTVCRFSELLQFKPHGIALRLARRTGQDHTAALLYSSGTTGTSKGVIITHRNLIAQAHLLLFKNDGEALEEPPWASRVYMALIPMFHVYGLAFFGCGLLYRGTTVVLLPKFDMVATLEAIQKYRVTHLPVVPPILIAFAKLPIVEKFDLSSLVQVGSGAAPLSKEVIAAFKARFPSVPIAQGYGLTESTAVGSTTANEEESKRYGSAGLLAPNTEAKIVDVDSGKPSPPNQRGEIWMRGPTIMKGYFGRPGETSATVDSNGWLHTGDLGFIDSEGFLFIVDRLKELIKYKGLQVAPAELEAVLLSHSEILDAAVIPYPDDEAGQIPVAFVVKDPKATLTEEEVIGFVAQQVAPYKKIRKVRFVSSIPKSAAGKILRQQLIREALSKL